MKLYLDCIVFNLQKAGGISVYWYELLKRLFLNHQDITLVDCDRSKNIFSNKLDNLNSQSINNKFIKISRYLPVLVDDSADIFHSSYYRYAKNKNSANIITVYDFIYEKFRKGISKSVHIWQKKNAIRKADGIVCISQSTMDDLFYYYPEVKKEKARVIHLGISDEFKPLTEANITNLETGANLADNKLIYAEFKPFIEKKFVLFLGGRGKHKNFNLVVDALSELKDYVLVVAGGPKMEQNEFELLARLKNRYFVLGTIDNKKLNFLYNSAYCLAYPSSYEGFGIPVIEAMFANCPVITTNKSSLSEVAGNAGLTMERIDKEDFIYQISRLEDTAFRKKTIELGRQHSMSFSWNKCYNETCEFYKYIWENKNRP